MLKPVATLELIYVDETGSTGAVMLNVPSATTVAVMDANAMALASIIAPMTDCALTRFRYTWKFVMDTVPSADEGASIVNAGAFLFSCDDGAPDEIIIIPSIKSSLLLTDGPTAGYGIDRSNSDVVALLDELLAIFACNPFGDFIVAIDAAYRQSRV